jgi:transcriptional regulator with XRE-family HTH domain
MSKEEKQDRQRIIGAKIRELRKKKELKQYELAKKAYISNSDMSKIEKGNKGIEPDQLKRIAQVLGCDTDHLVGKRDELTKENTDIMALLPLDEEAVEILQDLKLDCEVSQEAQFISDVISFFVKALYTDYGEDSVSFIRALNGLCEQYNGNPFQRDQTISRMNHIYVLAYKEELRETAARIMMEFCKNHPPVYRTQIKDTRLDMLDDNFWREVEEDGKE